jgi:hypothetical protein
MKRTRTSERLLALAIKRVCRAGERTPPDDPGFVLHDTFNIIARMFKQDDANEWTDLMCLSSTCRLYRAWIFPLVTTRPWLLHVTLSLNLFQNLDSVKISLNHVRRHHHPISYHGVGPRS